ncbi:pre-peptidase C-terminal domain-containing protein [Aliikangiella marina]|uniref:pre-peptidase C-terminal domain-containing protein n=1 Tax=Aliikangiella marina TaxID=1712262 RepID=UPI00163DE5CA|nr:pre-peptidase C-terminal domain-containing protein [Aliikangiella marina]
MKYPIKKVASAVTAGILGVTLTAGVSAAGLNEISLKPVAIDSVEQAPVRYIVKYKKTESNTMMKASGKPGFNAITAKSQLKARGIKVKKEISDQYAIAAMLTKADIKALRKNPMVESLEIDAPRKFMALYNDDAGDPNTTQLTPYAIYQSQANQLTLQPGQKVCVIDSGIAGSNGETGGLNNDFVWSNITGTNDSGTGNWNADGGPHGTHVAGTVGAADNGFGVIGMAPGVPMHIIKVFNAAGWGYSSDLAQAASDCANAGANIITMSLGGGAANSTERNAFDNFTANGGLVLAAAGNDGNTTRSYPAGYDSVMMIGANDADNNIADFSQHPSCNTAKTNCVEATAGGVNTLSTYPSGGATVAGLTADGSGYAAAAMENTGNASGSTYFMGTAETTDAGANGKICMIDRGNVSFFDKVKNCEDSGGIGAVIINNVAGILQGTLGTSNTTSIPALGADLADRSALIGASSASISVGPGDYGLMSGTSMATPGVAGVAALVWSNHPSCTGTEIRNVLKLTAEDAGATGHDVYFGNGIVKAKAASDYITANGCDGSGGGNQNELPTASFTSSCNDLSCSFNGSGSSDTDGSIAAYSWTFGDGGTATGASPSHNYSAAGTYTVQLTVTDNDGGTNSTSQTVTVTEPPVTDNVLTNGVAKTGLSAARGDTVSFTMEVPAGATDLSFVTTGGSGDADLYVRYGAAPTTSSYDCRPYRSGNEETCSFATPQAGTYYVMVRAYSAFSGVSLTGSFTEDTGGGGGATGGSASLDNLSGSRGNWDHYTLDIPAGMSTFTVVIAGGSGDADLFVRYGAQPTSSSYDCRPYRNGNSETCTFNNPAAGTWHISLNAYRTYSGVGLDATWNP